MDGITETEADRNWEGSMQWAVGEWLMGEHVPHPSGVADLDALGRQLDAGNWNYPAIRGGWVLEGRVARSGRRYVLLRLWEESWGLAGEDRAWIAGDVPRVAYEDPDVWEEEVEG